MVSEARRKAGKRAWDALPAAEKKRRLDILKRAREGSKKMTSKAVASVRKETKKTGGQKSMAKKQSAPRRHKVKNVPKGIAAGAVGTGIMLVANNPAGQKSASQHFMDGEYRKGAYRLVERAQKLETWAPLGVGAGASVVAQKIGINRRLPAWAKV